MEKKSFNSKQLYEDIQKQRKKLKIRAIILALFALGVSAYAWFIFVSDLSVNFSGHVREWDVQFLDDSTEINRLVIDQTFYPGMDDYSESVNIINSSDTGATFSFEINELTILGINSLKSTSPLTLASLQNDYPFVIDMYGSKTDLNEHDSLTFTVEASWPYNAANTFFLLTNHYTFDPSIKYYTYSSGSYNEANVTSENFSNLKSTLYVEKDDADSFFGEKCAVYENANHLPCIHMQLTLKVTQKL